MVRAYLKVGERQAGEVEEAGPDGWSQQKLDELMGLFGGTGGEVKIVKGG